METVARRVDLRNTGASFSWHRQTSNGPLYGNNVCKFWLSGNCTRNPCRFLHPDLTGPTNSGLKINDTSFKQSHASQRQLKVNVKVENLESNGLKMSKKRCPNNGVEVSDYAKSRGISNRSDSTAPVKHVVRLNRSSFRKSNDSSRQLKDNLKVEKEEFKDLEMSPVIKVKDCDHSDGGSKDGPSGSSNATSGDVEEVHCSSCYGDGFSKLAQLEEHKKAVTGITLPHGSDKLVTGSNDGTIRVWNCHTGKCVAVADVGAPVECLISKGPWIFVGLSNAIKVWNVQTNAEFILTAQGGQVHAMVAANGMLLAGVHDGSILVWKLNANATSFDEMPPLKGHTGAVVSLIDVAKMGYQLYSGSVDNTTRVWDLETMQCIYTLAKHSDVVTSLLCWEEYLISCSLDHTLKVWGATESGGLDVVYEHNEELGILSLCGMHDAANKPILVCSCNDNTVRLYELPSFAERGRIFAKEQVRVLHVGPEGLFFTGDGTGLVSVWKCSSNSIATPDKAV